MRRIALGFWMALAVGSAVAADRSAERLRITGEKQAIIERQAARERACRDNFVVTACVDEVRASRRQALAALRQQELALDDAERKERAEARRRTIDKRKAEVASRPPSASAPEPAERAASRPPPGPMIHAPRRPAVAEEARAAAKRASAAERRRDDAAADRARIAERVAEREAKRTKKAAPLPAPAP